MDTTNFYAYEGADGRIVYSRNAYYAWGIPTTVDKMLRQEKLLGVYTTLEEAKEALQNAKPHL
jgi:hypothetical protein